MKESPLILPMLRVDVAAVAGIARACFPVPWGADAFLDELEKDYAVVRVLRSDAGASVCAFAHFWCVAGEAQLMNLATLPPYRGRGYGNLLLADALGEASARDCHTMTLEVRRSNGPAIALYRRFDFRKVGVRQAYYADDGEDALVMNCPLIRTKSA